MFAVVLHASWLTSAHVGDEGLQPPWSRIASSGDPGHAKPELPLDSGFEVANASGLELVSAEGFGAATGSSCVFHCPPWTRYTKRERRDDFCETISDWYGGLVPCDALITKFHCFPAAGFCGYCGDFRPAPEAATRFRCKSVDLLSDSDTAVVELLPILPNVEPRLSGAWKAVADRYPNPWRDPGACGMSRGSSICDPEKILSEAWRDRVASRLQNFPFGHRVDFKECRGGASFQVAAAIVGRVLPPGRTFSGAQKLEALESFAAAVFDRWGVGHSECGDGVLLVLSMDLRYVFIRTGWYSREFITDAVRTTIVARASEFLRSDPGEGVFYTVDAIEKQHVKGGYIPERAALPNHGTIWHFVEHVIVLFFLISIPIYYIGFPIYMCWRRFNREEDSSAYRRL